MAKSSLRTALAITLSVYGSKGSSTVLSPQETSYQGLVVPQSRLDLILNLTRFPSWTEMVYWGVGPSYIGMNSSVPGMLWSSWKVTPGSDYKSAEPYWSSGYQSSAATLSSSLQLIASGVGGAGQSGSTSCSSSTESAPARRASPS